MFSDFDIFFDKTNNCYQVRTKTNCFVLDFDNDVKKEIFEKLIHQPKGSLPKVYQSLKKDYDESQIIDVLSNLNDNGLLTPEEISNMPELAKEQGEADNGYGELQPMEELNLLIISDGALGEKLQTVIKRNGIESAKIISADFFTSLTAEQITESLAKVDFCFMDASCWNPKAIDLLNKEALKQNKPWLHIGGLEEHLLKIGPLFMGNETGCYDCFIRRVKSNHEYVEYLRTYEKHLKNEGKSSKPDQFIHLDAFYELVANFAFLELTKFFQMWSVPCTWRKLIAINALDFDTHTHDLLKVPFCETCNEKHIYNPSPWLEPITI